MDGRDGYLDGNAAAGLLAEIFAFDITTAEAACDGCEGVWPLAAAHVYSLELGAVLRCPGCGDALIRVARLDGECRLDLRGTRVLRVSTPASGVR